jgi:hypothetical protein
MAAAIKLVFKLIVSQSTSRPLAASGPNFSRQVALIIDKGRVQHKSKAETIVQH